MNKFGLIVSLSLIATSAFATSGGEGNNTGCNGQGNENSPCAPDTPAATPTNVTSTAIAANLNKISNKCELLQMMLRRRRRNLQKW